VQQPPTPDAAVEGAAAEAETTVSWHEVDGGDTEGAEQLGGGDESWVGGVGCDDVVVLGLGLAEGMSFDLGGGVLEQLLGCHLSFVLSLVLV